jgi:dihydroorotate dehydrogenase electron transfer subunit
LKQIAATVIDNEPILKGISHRSGRRISSVNIIRLSCPQIEGAEPGQFVMVRCGEGPEYQLPRPFSIHRLNGHDIELLFNVWEDGRGTQWLAQCQTGDTVKLMGPLGNGFSIYPDSKKLLVIAGGIGIAPLRFLADEAVNRGLSVTLLLGAPTAGQLYPTKLLSAKAKLITTTEDGDIGRKGMITDVLTDFAGGADQVFACGPLAMYKAMAGTAELKDKPVQISLEVRMGCGLGICYGCTVKTREGLRQTCKHGPIFNLDEILWEEMAEI